MRGLTGAPRGQLRRKSNHYLRRTVLDTRVPKVDGIPSPLSGVDRARVRRPPPAASRPPLKGSEPMGTLSPDDSTLPPDSPGSPAVPLTAGERFTCEDVRGGGDDGDDRDRDPLIPLTAANATCAPVDGAASIGDLSPKLPFREAKVSARPLPDSDLGSDRADLEPDRDPVWLTHLPPHRTWTRSRHANSGARAARPRRR